jgi:hypothetical protein
MGMGESYEIGLEHPDVVAPPRLMVPGPAGSFPLWVFASTGSRAAASRLAVVTGDGAGRLSAIPPRRPVPGRVSCRRRIPASEGSS